MKATCPHCNATLDFTNMQGGSLVSCSSCNNPVTVPVQPTPPKDPQGLSTPVSISIKAPRRNVNRTARTHGKSYPNLTKYLSILRVLTDVIFILAIIGETIFASVSLVSAIKLESGSLVFLPFVFLIISLAATYLWRIIQLAGIEFIQVIMDIEKNTRK